MEIYVYNNKEFIKYEGDKEVVSYIDTLNQNSLSLYIDYEKGDESNLEITAFFKDSQLNDFYQETDENLKLKSYKISETSKLRFNINVLMNEEQAKIIFNANYNNTKPKLIAYIIPSNYTL